MTVTVAESLTETDPVPIEVDPVTLDCVVTLELPQVPKLPRTKSFSVAVVDVDDRVSDATDAEALVAEAEGRQVDAAFVELALQVGVGCRSCRVYGHGAVVPSVGLTMPQNGRSPRPRRSWRRSTSP